MLTNLWYFKTNEWFPGYVDGMRGEMITKGHKETFGKDEYVQYLDCGDGFIGYTMSKHQIVYFKYAQFIVGQTVTTLRMAVYILILNSVQQCYLGSGLFVWPILDF